MVATIMVSTVEISVSDELQMTAILPIAVRGRPLDPQSRSLDNHSANGFSSLGVLRDRNLADSRLQGGICVLT